MPAVPGIDLTDYTDTLIERFGNAEVRDTTLLILPNAWDGGSAALMRSLGARAIATTSAGVAWALLA